MGSILDLLRSRRVTTRIHFVLDECLPPVIRDRRWLVRLLARVYCGRTFPSFDVDFKRRVLEMTEAQFAALYAHAPGCGTSRVRPTDLTDAEIAWVCEHIAGRSVLEVGCGSGILATALAGTHEQVVAADVHPDVPDVRGRPFRVAAARIEKLPFRDRAFDTVVAAHALEHVVGFETAVREMIRVARQRILIVVPKQRYYRYTVDYHLHFFPDPEQLILRVGLESYECAVVTRDLCYVGILDVAACRTPA